MGIPSYFSYIIKNHANIIRNLRFHAGKRTSFSSLYMDCNSVIYDCVRKVESDKSIPDSGFEHKLIDAVISKIEQYVSTISPTNVLYIAFDGVAPFAKMEQQRIRRYKTGYLSSIDFHSDSGNMPTGSKKWNTSAITPGTTFMELLAAKVRRAFTGNGKFFGAKTVIVSAADEPGEGEHKMFQYMRENALQTETIAVYGLDSDLIMLSLFHCFACENIYIFREAPAFGKLAVESKEDEFMFLDNRGLASAILGEMGVITTTNDARGRIYDYIFMCFLLGNDFLPHFPALNIRTHGNYTILDTYKRIIGADPNKRFISLDSGNIQWKWVKIFLKELALSESRTIKEEYVSREKMERRHFPATTKEEREIAFDNIPIIYRAEEHYINPRESGWQTRYYRIAFHLDQAPTKDFVKDLCTNYLEGLEWVFKYYTEGCPHWRWKYRYHYPPLFVDLIEYVPDFETTFIDERIPGKNAPFNPNTQLSYVIPPWNHHLLNEKTRRQLKKRGLQKYCVELSDLQFQWTFCRYFWEAHALLPDVPLSELERMDADLTTSSSGK